MNKYNRRRIGEIHNINNEYDLEIIDGSEKANYCTVKIDRWVGVLKYCHILSGRITYPYAKTVCRVGFIGEGIYSNKSHKKVYTVWHSMLDRAYSKAYHEKQPTYKDASVCNEWHNFQVFAKWMEENYISGYHLDKDLVIKGNKVYSPETCIFLPREINNFISSTKATNTSGCIGVTWYPLTNRWLVQIYINKVHKNLGYFLDKKEAEEVYTQARAVEAKKLQTKYIGIFSSEILQKIL